MCSQTAGCAGWVIASGVSAGASGQDDKPFCWLKNAMAPIDKAPNRAHGKCVPGLLTQGGQGGAPGPLGLAIA